MNDHDAMHSLRENLRDLANLQPPADATQRATERALAAAAATATSLPQRSASRRWRWMYVAAAAVLVVLAASQWRIPGGGGGGLAFGAVQEVVAKTRSVRYTQVRKDRTPDGKAAPEETRKVAILGSHQMREEVSQTAEGDELPEGHRWGAVTEPHVMIHNAKTGDTLTLWPERKSYSKPERLLSIDPDSGEIHESKIEATPEADLYGQIRQFPADKAKRLDDRVLDGVIVAGFQVVEKIERRHGADVWTRTFWVDLETKLPVRIEISYRSSSPLSGASDWVKYDFEFDAPLDEALFSTDPPTGYTNAAKGRF